MVTVCAVCIFWGDMLWKFGMHCPLGQCHLLYQHNYLHLPWGQYFSAWGVLWSVLSVQF